MKNRKEKEAMTKIDIYEEGELIHTIRDELSPIECLERDEKILSLIGYFTESGMDESGYFWLVKSCGDNCRKYRELEI